MVAAAANDSGDSATTEVSEGGCLCGAVRYRVTGAPLARSICHCRSCRLASGAASVAWTVFRSADFVFASGAPTRFASSPPVVRSFCPACGTPLTYQHADSTGTIDVTTATLDHAERFAPTREVWTEQKLSWVPLNEGLEHFRRGSAEERDDPN